MNIIRKLILISSDTFARNSNLETLDGLLPCTRNMTFLATFVNGGGFFWSFLLTASFVTTALLQNVIFLAKVFLIYVLLASWGHNYPGSMVVALPPKI